MPMEKGISLDVPGAALVEQASQRLEWHRRNAAEMTAVLKDLPEIEFGNWTADDWKREERRRDLTSKAAGHQEYVRYLEFVRRHIDRRRIYRLSLHDLSFLEIMPKGSYY